MKSKKFLKHVTDFCLAHDVSLILSPDPKVYSGGIPCSGYFVDFPKKELAVAQGKPEAEWLEILVHEFCHLNQFLENDPSWKNLSIPDSAVKKTDLLDLWLARHIELSPNQLNNLIQDIIQVELDCEKRSVAVIKEFNLDIDVQLYTKKASSYLFFYSLVKEKRNWSKVPPYQVPEIVKSISPSFYLDEKYLIDPPTEILELIERYCF